MKNYNKNQEYIFSISGKKHFCNIHILNMLCALHQLALILCRVDVGTQDVSVTIIHKEIVSCFYKNKVKRVTLVHSNNYDVAFTSQKKETT